MNPLELTRQRLRCNGCTATVIVHDTPAVDIDGVLVVECGECGYKMVEA